MEDNLSDIGVNVSHFKRLGWRTLLAASLMVALVECAYFYFFNSDVHILFYLGNWLLMVFVVSGSLWVIFRNMGKVGVNELEKRRERLEKLVEERAKELRGVGEDIVRDEMQMELRSSQRKFQILVENIEDYAIFLLDRDGRIASWNKGAQKILGYDEEDIIGKHYSVLYTEDDIANNVPQRLLDMAERDGKVKAWHLHSRKDGSLFDAETTITRLQDRNGNLAGFAKVTRDVTELKRSEERIKKYQEGLKCLANKLTLAEEHERRRIASELHDTIAQMLALAKIKLHTLKKPLQSTKFYRNLIEVYKYVDDSIRMTRMIISELSPPILYDLGLEPAIDWLLKRFGEQHNWRTEFRDDAEKKNITEEVRITLFISVRELLYNIAKYANAKNVSISIGRTGDYIEIVVQDDGLGFDLSKVPLHPDDSGGFGLFSIKERLEHLGGKFTIESHIGKGTIATLTAPLSLEKF